MTDKKFPANMIHIALQTVESYDDHHPLDNARARGANEARQWICWLYGAVHRDSVPKVSFELTGGLPEGLKPTKLAFAMMLSNICDTLEKQYGFDPDNGYEQVTGKTVRQNTAYGFYIELYELAGDLDLWKLLGKALAAKSALAVSRTPRPSSLAVRKIDPGFEGSCNFCHNIHSPTVYAIESNTRLQVRMCPECVKAFRDQTRPRT